MSRNTTTRRTDVKSMLGIRRRKQYDTLADVKNIAADDILNIDFDNISGSIMKTGDAVTELNMEKMLALDCLLEKRKNKKMNIADVASYDINDCHRKLDKYRERKQRDAAEAKRITNMVMDEVGMDKFNAMNLPYAPIGKITTTMATTRKGGRRTRTRTSRKTRKSHKRHKKRSTKRRR